MRFTPGLRSFIGLGVGVIALATSACTSTSAAENKPAPTVDNSSTASLTFDVEADGSTRAGQIDFTEVACFYRQNSGVSDELGFHLQFRTSPDIAPLVLNVSNPDSGSDVAIGANDISVGYDGTGYRSGLHNSEVVIHLDDLPASGSLDDGELITLIGSVSISAFELGERDALAQSGPGHIALDAQDLAFACATEYQVSLVVN